MIEITRDPQHNISFSGTLTESEVVSIYCNASKNDLLKLNLLIELADNSKRISDALMYISELVRVSEDLAKEKSKMENEND